VRSSKYNKVFCSNLIILSSLRVKLEYNLLPLESNSHTMTSIKINVNKQLDGYSFSISPTIRNLIKTLFPNAHPANNILVAYDTKPANQ
jgi:hypothetical protein